MSDPKLHSFQRQVATSELPPRFTYPFCYTPHPLCVEAAEMVKMYLAGEKSLTDQLNLGKMLGVMVVEDQTGTIGFIAAYSGNLAHSAHHEYFVPAVYDLFNPEGEFCRGEAQITAINKRIAAMEADENLAGIRQKYTDEAAAINNSVNEFRQMAKAEKAQRDARRMQGNVTPDEDAEMTKRSQFLKAELKRRRKLADEAIAALPSASLLHSMQQEIDQLKQQRATMSGHLQRRLFQLFVVRNARGESSDLQHIFKPTPSGIPPAGAGECAAPKLMQYALTHNMRPRAMAEFWWGASPVAEVRHHGNFYPACRSKCLPILTYMMQGLQVDDNPHDAKHDLHIKVIYDDPWLSVVEKPSGLITVPGKISSDSLQQQYARMFPQATGPMIVHRLDMHTSGLVIVAKDKDTHKALQAMIATHGVEKHYEALLCGVTAQPAGEISLPLSPNPLDRPRQMVDREHGRSAITRYRVMEVHDGITRIDFQPITGRTHQLRLHAAHRDGLNAPIVGDQLYGHPTPAPPGDAEQRLCLHAKSLRFCHPVTGQPIDLTSPPPF